MGPLSLLLLLGAAEAEPYAALLEQHVHAGVVDYAALAKERATLDRLLADLAQAPLPKSTEAKVGFWIDAYNLLVLSEVVRLGSPKSVLEVPDFFSAPRHQVAGERLSLDQLEKQRILPTARDPRVHFAVVCGAKGCPVLESAPWREGPLSDRLAQATRRYLASPAGLRIDGPKLALSKIFEWYRADFGGDSGVRALVLTEGPPAARAVAKDAPLTYFEYDWRLNGP